MREQLIRAGLAAAVVGGGILGGACRSENPSTPIVRPTARPAATATATPEIIFGPQPLEPLPAPEASDAALIADVAHFFSERVPEAMPAEVLASKVHLLAPDAFVQRVEIIQKRPLTPVEKADDKATRLEVVDDDNNVLFNADLLAAIVKNPLDYQFAWKAVLAGKNPSEVRKYIMETTLVHAFSHTVVNKTPYDFAPTSLRIPRRNGVIGIREIGHMAEYKFSGTRDNGQPFSLYGANEAIVDRIAQITGLPDGKYISPVKLYASGASLIDELNKRAGISDEEFVRLIASQKQPAYLARIGKIRSSNDPKADEKAAILALQGVALHTQGLGQNLEEARRFVFGWLQKS